MKKTFTLILLSLLTYSCQKALPTLDDAKKEIETIIDTRSDQNITLTEFSKIDAGDTIINNYKLHLIKFNGSIEYHESGITTMIPFSTRNKENTFLSFVEQRNPFFRDYISVEKGTSRNITGFIYYYQKDNNWAVQKLAFGLKD